ncbi:MAG: hypothetical protein IAI49_08155, partial [Candidatus Eremiobacteraeota bacterium]|nr:hypothetical protein [Candidatus Eremiobacteraeota bacterium]
MLAVAAASLAFVANGVPLLRHDWFPIVPTLRFALDNVTGWDPTGLGSVEGYPASFLLIFARSAVAALTGSYATHLLYFGGYALLLVFGAARLVAILGGSAVARVAAALFAAFNPWAYTELVAGHTFMLLSYAATFWLVAECCTRYRRSLRLVLLALAVAPQIQFLIVDAACYALLSLRMRSWAVFLAIASMLLPVFVGVVVSRDVLVGIPLTLEWERDQSLDPFRAIFLRGYFAGYDSALAAFYEWSQWIVFGIACAGVLTIVFSRRRRSWLIAFAAIPLVWSFGLKGPLHGVFAWTIAHVPEAGLFRELYGLLGFVAIGYTAFCAIATARSPRLASLWFAAGAAMLAAWILAPPAHYWVTNRALPVTPVANEPNSRFLLVPALYPARLAERGSGTDPDLYPRADNVTPVNEAIPMYPLSPALGRYMRDGATDALGALSVGSVLARPWLQTDPSIRYQLALPLPDWLTRTPAFSGAIARVTPELSLGDFPAIGPLDTNIGAGNVLFEDAREATGPAVPAAWHALDPAHAVTAGNEFVRAADGWVDARLAFAEDPELAQPFGGALTTNRFATLNVVPSMFALVFVRGKLLSQDGTPIASTSAGFRWIFVPSNANALTCAGLCVVAAQATRLPGAPLNPPPRPSEGVAFRVPIPWLVAATLPAGSSPLLR